LKFRQKGSLGLLLVGGERGIRCVRGWKTSEMLARVRGKKRSGMGLDEDVRTDVEKERLKKTRKQGSREQARCRGSATYGES